MKKTTTKEVDGVGMVAVKSEDPAPADALAHDEPSRVLRVGAEEELTSLEGAWGTAALPIIHGHQLFLCC